MLRILSMCALILLSACATDRPLAFNGCTRLDDFRVGVSTASGDRAGPGAEQIDPGKPRDLREVFANSVTGARENAVAPDLNYLVLSGGGQWGAFGAGFLKGWSDHGRGIDARPARFDVVTGISTGALQSTFAFLGMPQDEALIEAYSITNERQLLKRHGSLFFISHASMADTGPASDYVRARVRPLLDKVAAPENAGRALLVGAVAALDGELYAIDLTRIARELTGLQREDCYVGALMASAAVPIVFRQVTVGGEPYFDGGVRKSVFVTEVQKAAGEALAAPGRKGRLFILINGDPVAAKVDQLPAKLLPSLNRLRSIVFNQVELSSIYETARTFPGMSTRIATASGNPCNAAADEDGEIFSPRVMACLRKYGHAQWETGATPWKVYPLP
jgi:predicted acylesterase/phospholipase RssA